MFEQLVPAVRLLVANDLGIGVAAKAEVSHASSSPDAPEVAPDDPRVAEIVGLAQRYGGVILTGPPGTSKSFFAAAGAEALTAKDKARYRFVQFHASYQYEDFMLGFSPTATGFVAKEGVFLQLVRLALKDRSRTYVLVIDELSRADVGRVFGEALTYVERTKRELPFTIANGDVVTVPSNLVIIATMNPFDRGVDEVDAAFERRFAKVSMEPDRLLLDEILIGNDMNEALRARVVNWFARVNSHARRNPAAAIGHAYFSGAADVESLQHLWDYQLQYVMQRAFRRDENTHAELEAAWERVFTAPAANQATPDDETSEGGT